MRTIILPGGNSQQIPDYALALPWVAQEPTAQPDLVQTETTVIANQNAEQLVWWQGKVKDWVTNNLALRLAKLPPTPKPVQSMSEVFHSLTDKDKTLWFWQAADGPPLGDPCPDLPPLPTPVMGIVIGTRLGDPNSPFYPQGTWFTDSVFTTNPDGTRTQHQDQSPAGTQTHGTSADGVTGEFLKWTSPWGGYWILESLG